MDRRAFLTTSLVLSAPTAAQRVANTRSRIKAVAFDGFPVIDSRPIATKAEEVFPGKGEALATSWRTRQFEYTWLRTLSGRYVDFWRTTEDALIFAAESMQVPLDEHSRGQLMG